MTDPETIALGARLEDLLLRQRTAYDRVLALALEQEACIGSGDTDGLMAVLGRKQKQIEAIQATDAALQPVLAAWESVREQAPAPDRERVEQALSGLRTVLQELVAVEDRSRAAAEDRRSDSGERVARLQTGKAMHKAYGQGPSTPGAHYKDRKG